MVAPTRQILASQCPIRMFQQRGTRVQRNHITDLYFQRFKGEGPRVFTQTRNRIALSWSRSEENIMRNGQWVSVVLRGTRTDAIGHSAHLGLPRDADITAEQDQPMMGVLLNSSADFEQFLFDLERRLARARPMRLRHGRCGVSTAMVGSPNAVLASRWQSCDQPGSASSATRSCGTFHRTVLKHRACCRMFCLAVEQAEWS